MSSTAAAPLFVVRERIDDCHVVRLCGDLDSLSVSVLREETAEVASARRVVIDLSDLLFVDSAGLGVLVATIRRVREHGGRIALCVGRDPIRRVLRVTGIDRLVAVHESEPDAIASTA